MRDINRERVYRSERNIIAHDDAPLNEQVCSIDEAREVIALLADEFGVKPPRIQVNRRIKAWGGWYQNLSQTIEFPREETTYKTVLHEFAHHLDPGAEGHGPSYCRAMLLVVSAWAGPEAAERLRASYESNGIDVFESIDERKQRLRNQREEREARNEERVGETGVGFIVEYAPGRFVSLDATPTKLYWTPEKRHAKVWRRESTGSKYVSKNYGRSVHRVHEVPVVYRRVWGERGALNHVWLVDWRALESEAS